MPSARPAPGLINQREAVGQLGVSGRQFRRWCRRHGVRPLHAYHGRAHEHLYDREALHDLWQATHPVPLVPDPAGAGPAQPAGGHAARALTNPAGGAPDGRAEQLRADLAAAAGAGYAAGFGAGYDAGQRACRERHGE